MSSKKGWNVTASDISETKQIGGPLTFPVEAFPLDLPPKSLNCGGFEYLNLRSGILVIIDNDISQVGEPWSEDTDGANELFDLSAAAEALSLSDSDSGNN